MEVERGIDKSFAQVASNDCDCGSFFIAVIAEASVRAAKGVSPRHG